MVMGGSESARQVMWNVRGVGGRVITAITARGVHVHKCCGYCIHSILTRQFNRSGHVKLANASVREWNEANKF